jgi:hypothetical protein
MSHKDEKTGTFYIVEEPPGRCEICGAVEETRPYGPDGKEVCFTCGMKDEAETRRQFQKRISGTELVVVDAE